jgi:hypothetical protein
MYGVPLFTIFTPHISHPNRRKEGYPYLHIVKYFFTPIAMLYSFYYVKADDKWFSRNFGEEIKDRFMRLTNIFLEKH